MTGNDFDAARHEPVLSRALADAIEHLTADRLGLAEDIVRRHLNDHPDDVAALCILGDLAARAGVLSEAVDLFQRAVDLAPRYSEARFNLARVLARIAQIPRAISELTALLSADPSNLPATKLRLALLAQTGQHDRAVRERADLLTRRPHDPYLWIAQANELKTVGRREEAIAGFRHALALNPHAGEAWWGLANLKVGALAADDVDAMLFAIEHAGEHWRRTIPTHFALARAFEDAGAYEPAFKHYSLGNALQRRTRDYDSATTTQEVDATIAQFTPSFAADVSNLGCLSRAPIFIVGMPRAGSTLVEQILASHSQVEGTSELPIIPALVNRKLGAERSRRDQTFSSVLARLDGTDLRSLGDEYIAGAAIYRHTDRPYFIDKLPTNWMDLALICTMLPNARIIDARRDALPCCFANWKQYFPLGHGFSNDLRDIAFYYRDYVRAIAHFQHVVPTRITRVDHTLLLENPEREIRALLEWLELPFEPACLTPHLTNRPVRTASSEQVRRPISTAGADLWRHFEPWLGEMKTALGDLA